MWVQIEDTEILMLVCMHVFHLCTYKYMNAQYSYSYSYSYFSISRRMYWDWDRSWKKQKGDYIHNMTWKEESYNEQCAQRLAVLHDKKRLLTKRPLLLHNARVYVVKISRVKQWRTTSGVGIMAPTLHSTSISV